MPKDFHAIAPLPGLTAQAFQHPDDRKATTALQNIPIFPQIIRAIHGSVIEKADDLRTLVHNVRLGPTQGGALYAKFVRAAQILNVQKLPDLFLGSDSIINAYASCMKRYRITLFPMLIDLLTEEELLAIIGHELGHVKCNHMVNKTLANLMFGVGGAALAQAMPVLGTLALNVIQWPLYYWSRMAEFSCDRAALLVVREPEIVASALAKLAGWSPKVIPQIDFESLARQLDDYHAADEKALETVLKMLMFINGGAYASHPDPVLRVQRILQWGASDQYKDILAGKYPKEERPSIGPSGTIFCSGCGQVADPSLPFCGICGTPQASPLELGIGCKACGKAIQGSRFCPYCGVAAQQPAIPAIS